MPSPTFFFGQVFVAHKQQWQPKRQGVFLLNVALAPSEALLAEVGQQARKRFSTSEDLQVGLSPLVAADDKRIRKFAGRSSPDHVFVGGERLWWLPADALGVTTPQFSFPPEVPND